VVGEVANRSRQAALGRDTQRLLVDQARAARDAVSGVNLDEEAAQMLRFQQAYQAAAQVIATADGLFQTLLDALRR
jgi:flagellar hook-associated protein 1 FlgK